MDPTESLTNRQRVRLLRRSQSARLRKVTSDLGVMRLYSLIFTSDAATDCGAASAMVPKSSRSTSADCGVDQIDPRDEVPLVVEEQIRSGAARQEPAAGIVALATGAVHEHMNTLRERHR